MFEAAGARGHLGNQRRVVQLLDVHETPPVAGRAADHDVRHGCLVGQVLAGPLPHVVLGRRASSEFREQGLIGQPRGNDS